MSSKLSNKRILLGVCGGIAAYKVADLARRLIDAGAEVRVVMTQAAQAFITPLTFQALTSNEVHYDLFDPAAEAAMGHIELARWADLILVAPATANFMAQLAHGSASDLLTTLCLVTNVPIVIVPAMNQAMWSHPATQHNLTVLLNRGVYQFGPDAGIQACGEVGLGRLLEPAEIIERISPLFASTHLNSKTVLITAGPTQEAIDAVRYLSNHSSGKMGYALAAAAYAAGAKVMLISGPVQLAVPYGVEVQHVQSATEMKQAVMQHVKSCDIFISAAAVADYHCEQIAPHKIKKSQDRMTLELVRTPDILSEVTALPNKPFTVGFAAETDAVMDYAKQKLVNKKLDMIIANQVGIPGQGFSSDDNQAMVITPENEIHLTLQNKRLLATKIIEIIANYFQQKKERK